MYGTVARTRVKAENRDELRKVVQRQLEGASIPGMLKSYVLWENDSDVAWLVAVFQDKASYDKNADDPAQHERYLEYSALMDGEPEWHDGEIEEA
ncbi:MAG TPA: antibiotic biosynthesis monooxygenase [Actinomycetota bacterium]|nr:antibiotic biosynthesis monooxygenase [Actinomycetota bacterium]